MFSFWSLIVAILLGEACSFGTSPFNTRIHSSAGSTNVSPSIYTVRTRLNASIPSNDQSTPPSSSVPSSIFANRRTTLINIAKYTTAAAIPSLTTILQPSPSNAAALPSVTSAEFDIILKDSAKSILSVELSGPKSETAIVKLIDGTTFSISDLIESSTDPRSPLKLVARCRLYNVPVKNVGLERGLSEITGGKTRKKVYMNERVQEAAEKEKLKRARMEEDEKERLEELYRLQGEVDELK